MRRPIKSLPFRCSHMLNCVTPTGSGFALCFRHRQGYHRQFNDPGVQGYSIFPAKAANCS